MKLVEKERANKTQSPDSDTTDDESAGAGRDWLSWWKQELLSA